MASLARGEDFKTGEAIIGFAHDLFEIRDRDDGPKGYGCTLFFPKGSAALNPIQSECLAVAKAAWPGKPVEEWIKDGSIKNPFLDGDSKQGKYTNKEGDVVPKPGHAGMTFIRCSSGADYKPKVFDEKVHPLGDKADLPSGSKVFAVINAYAWDHPKNGKGISFGVSIVQRVKKAEGEEVLGGGGGGPAPEKFLEKLADSGDAPDSTKTGDGAAGLFA